jgi:hypothetical protein
MNYSSGSIKEVYLDASNFTQSRCVFKLSGDMNYLSNMKLTGLGSTTVNASASYSRSAGVLALIKNISLMDGGTTLSQSREQNLDAAFKNMIGDNDNNLSSKTGLNFNRQGYTYGKYEDPAAVANTFRLGYSGTKYSAAEIALTAAAATTGTLLLSDVLPILKVLPMLDTAVFKDGLQLVIEWESDVRKIADNNANGVTILQPILCAYEVSDPMLYAQLAIKPGNVGWVEREVDQRPYAALDSITQRFNGFDNKHVLRLCVVKQMQDLNQYISTNSVQGMGPLSSIALSNESFNIVNQGRRLFPRDLTNFDIIRQTFNAYGDFSVFNGAIQCGGVTNTSSPFYINNLNTQVGNNNNSFLLPGQSGYNGVLMGNVPVRNLELSLTRDLTNVDGIQNQALNVFIFGDVPKVMSVGRDGSYLISYV